MCSEVGAYPMCIGCPGFIVPDRIPRVMTYVGGVVGTHGQGLRITGGDDKHGFQMKQGVLRSAREKLLHKKGTSRFRERRSGARKSKSARGCICWQ